MKKEIKFNDLSSDKKYFVQIPNIIVDEATIYEQSLYLIIKRISGEYGSCYQSLNTLAKKMGVDKKTVSKNIEKLLKRKWIAEISPIKVRGGSVRQFIITDIWKQNMDKYKSGRQKDWVKVEGLFPKVDVKRTESGRQMDTKKNTKEEYKNNIYNIVNYFFELKGWDYKENKENEIVYNSYTNPAKQLLEICKSNLEIAKSKLKEIKDWAESRGLDWSLSTAVKRFKENNSPKQKITKEYYMGNPIFQKFGREYVMGSDGIERIFDRRMANPKDIEVKEI